MIDKSLSLLARNLFSKSAITILLTRNIREELELSVYIKKEKKIKKIISITTKNIINKIRKSNITITLSICKNIVVIKRYSNIITFRMKTKESKKILKTNNY